MAGNEVFRVYCARLNRIGGFGTIYYSYNSNPEGRVLVINLASIREFPKFRVTLFWGPHNKDPTIILGSPIFGNSQIGAVLV